MVDLLAIVLLVLVLFDLRPPTMPENQEDDPDVEEEDGVVLGFILKSIFHP